MPGLLDETLEESISMLKPKEKVVLWMSQQEFIRPKLQRMNVEITPVEDRITKITFEVVEAGMIPEANIKTLPIGENIEGIRSIAEIENIKTVDENYWRIYGLGEVGQITGLVRMNDIRQGD